MKLHGRKALITGASEGLGAVIAEHYLIAGASVMLCARGEPSLRAVRNRLLPLCRSGQEIHIRRADVSIPAEVDGLVEAALAAFQRLDILVNNAGVYGPFGPIEAIDWNDWTHAIAINLMGTVYPCRTVVPHFKKQRYGKIVNLSGGGATNPLPGISAYAASKAAVVRFTETLALEAAGFNIDVNAVAPGTLATRLTDQLLAAGPDKVGAAFHARISKLRDEGGTPFEKGAALCVYLGSAESDGVTGKLISAVWDPWPTLHQHKADLTSTDIYALRRISPKDRGKTWGTD